MIEVNTDINNFTLAKRIMKETDLTGAIVYGLQRSGKSSYALQTMHQIYGNWDDALKYTFFKLSDVTAFLRNCIDNDKRIKCFCWDDVGVHAGAQVYNTNRFLAHHISSLFDVIGTITQGVIFTTPNPLNLLKALRGYEFYRVKVEHGTGKHDRVAHGYISKMLPSGTRRIYGEWDDYFDVRVPCYDKYYTMRKQYSIDVVSDIERFAKNNEEESKESITAKKAHKAEYMRNYMREKRAQRLEQLEAEEDVSI